MGAHWGRLPAPSSGQTVCNVWHQNERKYNIDAGGRAACSGALAASTLVPCAPRPQAMDVDGFWDLLVAAIGRADEAVAARGRAPPSG